MRILCLLIASAIFFQSNLSFANATNQAQIERSFNLLRYELEVAQADDVQAEILASNLMRDLLASGIEGQEIMDFVKGKLNNEAARKDLDALIKTMSIQNLSHQEMVAKLTQFFNQMASEGASYRGTRIIIHTTWPIAVIIATVVILTSVRCVNCGPRYRY